MMARASYTCIAGTDRPARRPIGQALDDGVPAPGNQIGRLQGGFRHFWRIGRYVGVNIRPAQIHQNRLEW